MTSPAQPKKLTSTDMIELLRIHYLPKSKPAGGIFAPEIGSPDGKRKADLIWQSITNAGGYHLIGHEVKVSRADVMMELSDLTKAESWSQYCNQWFLVISDPKIIEGLNVPETWGIMSPPSGRRTKSMTVIRDAPVRKHFDQSDALRRLLSWHLYRVENEVRPLVAKNESLHRENNRLNELLRQNPASMSSFEHQKIERIVSAIREKAPSSFSWYEASEEDIVEAVVDVTNIRRAKKTMERQMNNMSMNIKNADRALKEIHHIIQQAEQFKN